MKLRIRQNFEVIAIAYPDTMFRRPPDYESPERGAWEEDELVRAKEVEAAIKRHCDVERVYATWQAIDVCSFCGSEWEEDDDGNPQCCQQAQDEFGGDDDATT